MVSKSTYKTIFFLLLINATAYSFTLFAQNTSGSITGVVQDKSGAVISGARATLINQEQAVIARQKDGHQTSLVRSQPMSETKSCAPPF
jgi:hypothetical protein